MANAMNAFVEYREKQYVRQLRQSRVLLAVFVVLSKKEMKHSVTLEHVEGADHFFKRNAVFVVYGETLKEVMMRYGFEREEVAFIMYHTSAHPIAFVEHMRGLAFPQRILDTLPSLVAAAQPTSQALLDLRPIRMPSWKCQTMRFV